MTPILPVGGTGRVASAATVARATAARAMATRSMAAGFMATGVIIGGLAAGGFVAATAQAGPPHRLVVVVGRTDDPRALRQHAVLEQDAAALRERDVVVQALTPGAARRERPELGVPSGSAFAVLLVGRDGGVKMRRDAPVAASEITALIDTMPMRRSEMTRRGVVAPATP